MKDLFGYKYGLLKIFKLNLFFKNDYRQNNSVHNVSTFLLYMRSIEFNIKICAIECYHNMLKISRAPKY